MNPWNLMRLNAAGLLILFCAAIADAQQPAGDPPPEETITRTYLVGDLARFTPNYPLEQPPSVTQPTPSTEAEDALIRLIQDTVASDSWKDNGGTIGSIRFYQAMLIVTQTKAHHEQVQALLEELRRGGGAAQVTIRATWVVAAPGEMTKPLTEVSADWMSKQKTYCESQITCFNGQTVHLTSGREKRIVSDVTPIVGTQAVAFDPTVEQVHSGMTVQFSPLLVGTDAAVLDVQSSAAEWSANAEPPAQMGKASSPELPVGQGMGNVDRVPTLHQQMKTTVRVPLRKKVIVGGMTLDPSDAQQAGRQLYLVVEIDGAK